MKLFGLAGTAGSGKNTVSDILCEMFDMHHFNTSDYVRAVTRFVFDLPPDASPIRDQLFEVATVMRELNQASTVQMGIMQAKERNFEVQLISGLRTMGEANAIRAAGGLIIGVDADPKIRHERIQSRVRDDESKRNFEDFLAQDQHENEGVGGGEMQGIRYVVDSADILITNEGSPEDLKTQIKEKFAKLGF